MGTCGWGWGGERGRGEVGGGILFHLELCSRLHS